MLNAEDDQNADLNVLPNVERELPPNIANEILWENCTDDADDSGKDYSDEESQESEENNSALPDFNEVTNF